MDNFSLASILDFNLAYLSLIALHVFFIVTIGFFTIKLWKIIGYFFHSLMQGDIFAKIILFLCVLLIVIIAAIIIAGKYWLI